jgi:hypothetical protein
MIPDLPWTRIAWALAAVLAILLVLRWRKRREWRDGGSHSGGGYDSGHGSRTGYAVDPPQTFEQRELLQAAKEVRTALAKHSEEMGALRTFWSQRLDELSGRIGELANTRPGAGGDAWRNTEGGGSAVPFDSATSGGGGSGGPALRLEPAWTPGPGDQPVEVRDGVLVVSRSLPPAGYLAASGSGQARVYLNADVPLTEFSLPRWAAFFDLQEARPYAAYRTRRPAEVRWDEGAGRGELINKGLAEAI